MVFAPATQGDLGIAPRHAPLLTMLKPAKSACRRRTDRSSSSSSAAVRIEIQPNKVTVLADTALRASDLDEAAALAAKQRAEETLRGATDKIEQAEAMKEIVRMAEQVKMIQRMRKGK
jgi:F-type H+-transporting ATPase subunit epsilon